MGKPRSAESPEVETSSAGSIEVIFSLKFINKSEKFVKKQKIRNFKIENYSSFGHFFSLMLEVDCPKQQKNYEKFYTLFTG